MASLIDLHLYTCPLSGDRQIAAGARVEAAIEVPFTGVTGTEHWVIEGTEVKRR